MTRVLAVAMGLSFAATAAGCIAETGDYAEEMVAATEDEVTVATNFRVGLQLTDHGTNTGYAGDWAFSTDFEQGGAQSPWACDNNCWQPDSARLDLDGFTTNDVKNRDFRICMVGSDNKTAHTAVGVWRCTPWASAGGGMTGMATDNNQHDPDSYMVKVETRTWPGTSTDRAADVRLRIRGYDLSAQVPGPGAWSSYTGWASQGGGISGWGCDANCFDPDGFEIEMNVVLNSVSSFCTAAHPCEPGFGDCDSNTDCVAGATCVLDVGNAHGYVDNTTDVCVGR
jgi:hypothetical protein